MKKREISKRDFHKSKLGIINVREVSSKYINKIGYVNYMTMKCFSERDMYK